MILEKKLRTAKEQQIANDEQAREDWEKLVSKAVRNQDLYNAKLKVELRQILYANQRIKALEEQLNRATRALERAGFEDLGGQEWKPPLGKPPKFIETAPGWISVETALPKLNCPVLICSENGPSIGYRVNGGWIDQLIEMVCDVTCWMEIPEPLPVPLASEG